MRLRIVFWLCLTLLAAPFAAAQRKSPINGKWEIRVGAQTYLFTLAEDQGDVTGTAVLPDGTTVVIDYGLIVGAEFEFSTTENNVEYEWTAELSRSGLKGERLNLDDDSSVRFTGKKKG